MVYPIKYLLKTSLRVRALEKKIFQNVKRGRRSSGFSAMGLKYLKQIKRLPPVLSVQPEVMSEILTFYVTLTVSIM